MSRKVQELEESLEIKRERVRLAQKAEQREREKFELEKEKLQKKLIQKELNLQDIEKQKELIKDSLIDKELLLQNVQKKKELLENEIAQIMIESKNKENQAEMLTKKVMLKEIELEEARAEIAKQQDSIVTKTVLIEQLKEKNELLEQRDVMNKDLGKQLNDAREKSDMYQASYTRELNKLIESEKHNALLEAKVKNMEEDINDLRKKLLTAKLTIELKEEEAKTQQVEAETRMLELEERNRLVSGQKRRIENLENLNNALEAKVKTLTGEVLIFQENSKQEKKRADNLEENHLLLKKQNENNELKILNLKNETKMLEDMVVEKTKQSLTLKQDRIKIKASLNESDQRLQTLRELLQLKEKKLENLLVEKELKEEVKGENKELREMGLGLCKIIDSLKTDLNGVRRKNQDLVDILVNKV
jgi:hypothetical protein